MQSVKTEISFDAWLEAATNRARAYWENCKAASAERAARGGPTLGQMWEEYQALLAAGGGDFDPDELRAGEDALCDALLEEMNAAEPFVDCLSYELDRMFHNTTLDTAIVLSARVLVSLN
jgi:hypothetical protein